MDQDLIEQMEIRYGAAFAQNISDKLGKCEAKEIQYLEVKQMTEIMMRYRARVKEMVKAYRALKIDIAKEQDEMESLYKTWEAQFLRRQLHDAWKMYQTVHHDFCEMYQGYMDQLNNKAEYSPMHSKVAA